MYVTRKHDGQIRHVWYETFEAHPEASMQCVVLHGGPGFTSASLRSGMTYLAATRPVTHLDLPGCGQSSRHPGSGYPIRSFVEDVQAVIDALDARPILLVGHAWGAILATRVALAGRSNIAGIVMVNPLRVLGSEGQDEAAQARAVAAYDSTLFERYQSMAELARQALAGDPYAWTKIDASAWPREMFATQFACPPPTEWITDMADASLGYESYFAYKGAVLFKQDSAWASYDLRNDASRLRIPVRIVVGESDANYSAPNRLHATPLLHSMTGADLIVFEGCGHFLPVEKPEEFALAITELSERLVGPTANRRVQGLA